MSNVLILTASARPNSNSRLLAKAYAEGAQKKGHIVKILDCAALNVGFCHACNACFQNGQACARDINFEPFAEAMAQADVLVLATPLYWYSFPAQMKAVLDKMYAFIIGNRPLPITRASLLVCGEIDNEDVFAGIVKSYELITADRGWQD